MAVAVAEALENEQHLVVEAGTGVGKSIAYLIPSVLFAIEQSKKAVISTHTINLQEQLLYKDIPILKKILPVEFEAALMKGRQNYLCPRRLERALQQAGELFTTSEQAELMRISDWARTTTTARSAISRSSRTRRSGGRFVARRTSARRRLAGRAAIVSSSKHASDCWPRT
jgi:ATP-dependent DNA helicase DinG